ncbi:MAG TPA: hypothetical protein VD905_00780 [Flavobacteriales bacterium]|nr:hypothetical protein [Flavobacteriales bacterium]
MIRQLLILAAFFYTVSLQAQKIKSITAFTSYRESKDTSFRKTQEWLFDEQGHLLQFNDFENKRFQFAKYDEKGKKLKDGYEVGDYSSKCLYSYTAHGVKKQCIEKPANAYRILTDSLDEDGKLLTQQSEIFMFKDDGKKSEKSGSTHSFTYDADGRLVCINDVGLKSQVVNRDKRTYDKNGNLVLWINGMENTHYPDTVKQTWGGYKNLLTMTVKKYDIELGQYYMYKDLTIAYTGKVQKNLLNDTLLKDQFRNQLYITAFNTAAMPAIVHLKNYQPGKKTAETDVTHTIKYDASGRLESVVGHWVSGDGTESKSETLVEYGNGDGAIVKLIGYNYMGSRVIGNVYIYKGDLLQRHVGNTEHGFPFSIKKYQYSFFE